MAKERTVPLGVDIPEDVMKKLHARRDTTGLKMKRIVADALREHLDKPYSYYVDGAEKAS